VTDDIRNLVRSHTCGELRPGDVGTDVVLMGWVHKIRDLGSLVFLDIRDRYGITQVVAREGDDALAIVKQVRPEFVVAITGPVERRSDDTLNPKIGTGEVEVAIQSLTVLSEAQTPPFQIDEETPVSEEVRLRYRYLDLRRDRMRKNIGLRHRIMLAVRTCLDKQDFWEIETPLLTKSTPEGARDYLVPSRLRPGEFYALPQSPQIFKQILMISGMDKYFQIVKCFRDEDLRADRQPEFTQIDVEMSFVNQEAVFKTVEELVRIIFQVVDREVHGPFVRLTYDEAMNRYGTDKPDLRCQMPVEEVSDAFRGGKFKVFRELVDEGGSIRALVVPGAGRQSRAQLDKLVDEAIALGAKGLVWVRRSEKGDVQSSILKVAGEEALARVLEMVGAQGDDLALLAGGFGYEASVLLGQLRTLLGQREGLVDENGIALVWVTDFPLVDWSETEQRFVSMHHPFTSPRPEDLGGLEDDPASVRSQAYDLVLNGSEIAGGSIRIHDSAVQARIFRLLKISDADAKSRFGFFLDSLQYGTPPHGGIAFGLDRIIAILAGEPSIRDVMAFPKTAGAVDLMAGSPSTVDKQQLRDLHLDN
tara:strand:- start:1131 stop:2897 length:1767 start_codon:yes stop_codon:yes gene_type:complete